jgi:hypothetical protein
VAQTPPSLQTLGRVLVTIDDLEALCNLLRNRSEQTDPIEIEFPGGTIGEAADLRELSDMELADIKVKAFDAEVVLSTEAAYCLGGPAVGEFVYRNWARARQTKERPSHYRGKRRPRALGYRWATLLPAGFLGVLTILYSLVIYIVTSDALDFAAEISDVILVDIEASAVVFNLIAVPLLGVLLLAAYLWLVRLSQRPKSFALIIPLSLDEYRKNRIQGRRQLITWLIAMTAIAATVSGILVGVLVAK